jgi:Cu/Ag efflux protein CusF
MNMNSKHIATAVFFTLATLSAAHAQDDNDALIKQAQETLAAAPSQHIQATITGIEPDKRTVTLRGPHREVRLVVSKDVTNFDQLHVGDKVDVDYKNALLVTAEKVTGKEAGERKRSDKQSVTPASSGPNGESSFESARQTEIVATVEHIDPKHHKITLRGPWRTETIDLTPEFESQKFKKGDTVHAVFVSAAAVKVTPVAK